MLTEVPLEVWRPKVQNKYITPDYTNDVDEGVFDFEQYGKALYRPQQTWKEGSDKNLITFNNDKNGKELNKHIKLNSRVTLGVRERLTLILKTY